MVLRGGHLCDPVQGWDGPADLYLRDGRVAAVLAPGAPPPAGQWRGWDASGFLVVPGPIDTLCACPAGGDPWREDLDSLSGAAAAGGYTALMVHTGSADPDRIGAVRGRAAGVRLHPVAALQRDGGLADLGLLQRAGAVAASDWPGQPVSPRLLRQALEYGAGVGLPVVAVAQDAELAGEGLAHEGPLAFALGLRGIPACAEEVAVARAAALQRSGGGRLHLAALSSSAGLEWLGAEVTAAVSAHHLLLTDAALRGYDTAAKLAPPLRGEADRAGLVAAVRAGLLFLASDHRPTAPEEKDGTFEAAACGASAVETALAAALEVLDPAAFVRACASGPAAAFGLPGGTLGVGAPADVAVFAPRSWRVDWAELRSRGRCTPLAGRRLAHRAVLTVVAGRVVYADAQTAFTEA